MRDSEAKNGVPWKRFETILKSATRDSNTVEDLVATGVISHHFLGWGGILVTQLSTKSLMTFYPSTPQHRSLFANSLHKEEAAIIKPSREFWAWLADAPESMTWQMRGTLKLKTLELAAILGPSVSAAIGRGDMIFRDASVWAGAGSTRTPLHVDEVHALILQVAGQKQFFLSGEDAIAEAVNRGTGIPSSVLTIGTTDCFMVEGTLQQIYGLDSCGCATNGLVEGRCVTLSPGDCLLLPAGLYHDVQAANGPSFSVTFRFSLQSSCSRHSPLDCDVTTGNKFSVEELDSAKAGTGPRDIIGGDTCMLSDDKQSEPSSTSASSLFRRWRRATATTHTPQADVTIGPQAHDDTRSEGIIQKLDAQGDNVECRGDDDKGVHAAVEIEVD